MSEQAQAWAGEFGDSYTKRNRVDWRLRIPFWDSIINRTGARSVWEFGCNAGWNLSACDEASPRIMLSGYEINERAAEEARQAGLAVSEWLPEQVPCCDLAFTCGVLIHIPPDELRGVMRTIIDASRDWVLAVEYASISGEEEGVDYQGREDMLWRRDYGRLYADLGLTPVAYGPADARAFDRCTWWLMRK